MPVEGGGQLSASIPWNSAMNSSPECWAKHCLPPSHPTFRVTDLDPKFAGRTKDASDISQEL